MTDTEWIAKLEADFGKLQRNRQSEQTRPRPAQSLKGRKDGTE